MAQGTLFNMLVSERRTSADKMVITLMRRMHGSYVHSDIQELKLPASSLSNIRQVLIVEGL